MSEKHEEDSDDEPVLIRKKKSVNKTILQSDSEDEEDLTNNKELDDKSDILKETGAEICEQHLHANNELNQVDSGLQSTNDNQLVTNDTGSTFEFNKDSVITNQSEDSVESSHLSQKSKKKKINAIIDSDESENEERNELQNNSSGSEEEEKYLEKNMKNIIKSDKVLDAVFDAEVSSSDEEQEDKSSFNPPCDEGYHGDEGESEEDEPTISAALKRKLAQIGLKGASKKNSSSAKGSSLKAQRVKKEDMTQLHSESQRMMREREVKMPYHNPKKVGLSTFLARTQQKQEALKTVAAPGSWKNKPDLALLCKSENEEKHLRKSRLKEIIEEKIKDKMVVDNEYETISETCNNITNEVENVKKQLDLDELPDLIIESDKSLTVSIDSVNEDSSSTLKQKCTAGNKLLQLSTDQETLVVQDNSKFTVNDINPYKSNSNSEENCLDIGVIATESATSANLIKSCDNLNHDSGYLTTPLNSSEEESNGTTLHHDNQLEESTVGSKNCVSIKDDCNYRDNRVDSSDCNENNHKVMDNTNTESIINKTTEIVSTHETPEITNSAISSQANIPLSEGPATNKIKSAPKLINITMNLPQAPRLNGSADSFIDLSDTEEDDHSLNISAPPSGVQKLMERLMQHSGKKATKKGHDVEINTVIKDKGENNEDKEELKVEKFVYHIDAEEQDDPKLRKPGAKLLRLKETLQERMAAEREKARKMKSQMIEMDNEEGYEDEEEMTDQSDSEGEDDIDEEVDEEEDEEMDLDQYTNKERNNKESNPFVDDEAEDEEDDYDEDTAEDIDEEGLHLQFDTQDSQDTEDSNSKVTNKGFLDKALTKTKSLELFDEEANTESPTMSQKSNTDTVDISERPFEQLSQGSKPIAKRNQDIQRNQELGVEDKDEGHTTNSLQSLFKDASFNNSMDSSFELMGSMIPAGQRASKKINRHDDSPSSKSSHSTKKSSCLSMPIENTQDLFNLSTVTSPSSYSKHSENLNFHLNESESNLLDEDGMIKMESSSKKSSRRQLLLAEKETIDADDEMLGLCSGQFTEGRSSQKSLFEDQELEVGGTQELLGLCSGHFTEKLSQNVPSSQQSSTSSPKSTGTQPFEVSDSVSNIESTQGNMNELLGLCSGVFTEKLGNVERQEVPYSPEKAILKRKKTKPILEEEDDFEIGSIATNSEDEQAEELGSDEEIDPNKENQNKFGGLFSNKKKLRHEFVDQEAELSGSEAESDEDYDLKDEEDILEFEEGDNDVLMSEEELRNQVGRVHLKSVIDSDKKQIRLMQEMYLQDGDLHNEGGGRERKFRWRNIDEDTQDDLFNNASDEDVAEDDIEQEKWRVERHEREKFLKEQKEKDEKPEEDQTIKLGKVCFKPKKVKSTESTTLLKPTENIVEPAIIKKSAPPTPPGLFKKPSLKINKAGSFLTRSNQALKQIAERNKVAVGANINGPRGSSRGFVFNTLSAEEKEAKEENKPQVKRMNSTPTQSVAKRPRLDRSNSIPKDSIFNLIN